MVSNFLEPWDRGRLDVGGEGRSRALRLSCGWSCGGDLGELKLAVPSPAAFAVLVRDEAGPRFEEELL